MQIRPGFSFDQASQILASDSQLKDKLEWASQGTDQVSLQGSACDPVLSGDGRYVAFAAQKKARTFSPGFETAGPAVQYDVFIRDRKTGQVEQVNPPEQPAYGVGSGRGLSLSGDGRYLAYASAGDGNGPANIFVYDRQSHTTRQVSQGLDGHVANGSSMSPSLSADGQLVAFQSDASNLVEGDTNHLQDVFVKDLASGRTRRESLASDGSQARGDSSYPVLSGDGGTVAFEFLGYGLGDNLARDPDEPLHLQIARHDRVTGETRLVQPEETEGDCLGASLSKDGSTVGFWAREPQGSRAFTWTSATGPAPVKSERWSRQPQLAADAHRMVVESRDGLVLLDGHKAPILLETPRGQGIWCGQPVMSANGNTVAFVMTEKVDFDLVPGPGGESVERPGSFDGMLTRIFTLDVDRLQAVAHWTDGEKPSPNRIVIGKNQVRVGNIMLPIRGATIGPAPAGP